MRISTRSHNFGELFEAWRWRRQVLFTLGTKISLLMWLSC
jgi:hypothetical protein